MTPDDLRVRLSRTLLAQRQQVATMAGLYDGTLPLAHIDPAVLRAMDGRIRPVACNLARLAADSVAQRLTVAGFRSAPDDVADDDIAGLWRATAMPLTSGMLMLDALVLGRSYAMVWAGADGMPVITPEAPTTTAVLRDPVTRQVTSAIKRWRDDDGTTHSVVLTADYVREYVTAHATPVEPLMNYEPPLADADTQLVREEPNPLGTVPVVPIVNRPRTSAPDGESDLLELEDPVRAISKLSSDLMTASEWAAMPRRYIATPANVSEEQAREVQKVMIHTLAAANGSKVAVLGGGASMGELSADDLAAFKTGIELLVDEVAALGSLPGYWVRSSASAPTSADAIRAAEHRLTEKVRQRQGWFGPAFCDVMRLAQRVRDGYADPRLANLEAMWIDPEPRTVAQEADAMSKLYSAGIIDRRAALEALDLPPLEVERVLAVNPVPVV